MPGNALHHTFERTAVGPDSRWQPIEVYYSLDPDGSAKEAYTFMDSEVIRRARHVTDWQPGRNPLFIHATDPAALMAFLDSIGWILETD
jgi:hypothetical protein